MYNTREWGSKIMFSNKKYFNLLYHVFQVRVARRSQT